MFNSEQVGQFTRAAFLSTLQAKYMRMSMDGVGRVFENTFVEQLWRSVKYKPVKSPALDGEVSLKEYTTGLKAYQRLKESFRFYNGERLYQSLAYRTPAEIYYAKKNMKKCIKNTAQDQAYSGTTIILTLGANIYYVETSSLEQSKVCFTQQPCKI